VETVVRTATADFFGTVQSSKIKVQVEAAVETGKGRAFRLRWFKVVQCCSTWFNVVASHGLADAVQCSMFKVQGVAAVFIENGRAFSSTLLRATG
jgi:hypothetical protein